MSAINKEPHTRLDEYRKEFQQVEIDLTQQFIDRGILKKTEVPEDAIHIQKYAASAAVSDTIPNVTKQLMQNPDDVRLGMQVVKANYGGVEGRVLCFPGGGVMSAEEHDWIAAHPDVEIQGNFFYQLAQDSILETGRFDCHYPDWQNRECAALERTIVRNTLREFQEELGQEAASKITLEKIFDGARLSTLTTIKFPDAEKSAAIADKYAHLGVTYDGKVLTHIYTTIEEYFGIASTPYLDTIAKAVEENDETFAFQVHDIPTILERGKRAVTEPGAHNNIGEYDLRNPSTAVAMVKLMEYFKSLIEGEDTYIEGPRRESKY